MTLLLIELDLLDKKSQYTKIKVLKNSKGVEQIKTDIVRQEGEASSILINTASLTTLISLKRDN